MTRSDFMTTDETKAFLGVTRITISNLRRRGLLNAVFLYDKGPGQPLFFLRSEVESFFDQMIERNRARAEKTSLRTKQSKGVNSTTKESQSVQNPVT
ncbi:MAG: helix-turn-helix domain-containing protein [Candidatus Riflebacteria bacterium]|nr:helix-turn-helix domain-containing protein [Candidatus Riflebacteria bacterium]